MKRADQAEADKVQRNAATSAATPLPPDLAELEQLASAADAQLAGVDLVAPGQAAPAPEVDEAQEVAAMLSLISFAAGKAMPPIAEVYDAEACSAIATQYMRCAEAYGWTFHKAASSPIVGLVAAAAMPALLNFDKFENYIAERRAAAEKLQRQAATSSAVTPLPPIETRPQALG